LPGVWVSEDIWKDRVIDYEYKDYSIKGVLYHPAAIANSMAILKIPRAKNLNGELVAQKCKGMTMSISGGNSIQSIAFRMTGIEGYIPVRRGDLYYYNIGQDISPEEFGLLNTSGLDPHVYSKTIKTDNDAYGAYIFWGDEQLKRPNAQIAAFVRQSVQNTQALIAGHLSRSKYSSSEEMAGNLFAGLASDAINSFMDYLMVSTERIFGSITNCMGNRIGVCR